MIVRIEWATPNEHGHRMYQVFEAKDYYVENLTPESLTPPANTNIRLRVDSGKQDYILCNGDTAYVMNNEGKTVDIVRS